MPEFLVKDRWATGPGVWVEADTIKAALIKRENELRTACAKGREGGMPLLRENDRASHYTETSWNPRFSMIDVSIAGVSCRGLACNVTR